MIQIKVLADHVQVISHSYKMEFVLCVQLAHLMMMLPINAKQFVFQTKSGITMKKNVFALQQSHISVELTALTVTIQKCTIRIQIVA